MSEFRRAQASMLDKQEKNDKKKENEEFLDSLVRLIKHCGIVLCFNSNLVLTYFFNSNVLSVFKLSPVVT